MPSAKKRVGLLWAICVLALPGTLAFAQGKTTGRITGTVKDINGALIVGATIRAVNSRTAEQRVVITSEEGIYSVSLLASGSYGVTVSAPGFSTTTLPAIVAITETLTLDVILKVAGPQANENFVVSAPPFTQVDGPQLGRVVNSRAVSELPLATRNFTQILALSPGTSVELADNSAVGRNSQNISVNGARTNQNNYQINGVDANHILSNNAVRLAVPAPETIQEFKVQTSLYDATFGRSGGGNVQAVTKSGANDFHGGAYEYFLNDALNANNPFLKAAGTKRPVLRRNIIGGLIGGHIKRDKAFFFASYQGTRERNGASANSLSSSVLITPNCCLTDDRSESTLRQTFNVPSINPVSLKLLNARLPSGQFLIPTPRASGRYSGSAISTYREDQFNANIDYRISEKDWFATRFFFSNAPQNPALFGGPNVPGFGAEQTNNNRLVSLQEIHTFSPTAINEARFGYNFIRQVSLPREPVNDSDMGISRANANAFPGLPLIRIAPNAGGIVLGTATTIIDQHVAVPSTTLADVLSITRGKHSLRMGIEVIYYQVNVESNFSNRGQIDFNTFNDFLRGTVSQSVFGTGINYRSLRATDYNLFAQDDWKFSPKLTLNLGLRYELDLPAYDTRGRIATFDPSLYRPRLACCINGNPIGPPSGGFVQAGNVIPEYDLLDVPNVGKRVVTSSDPNNLAPRIGFAYSPMGSGRLVVRGGYGIFYSRTAATHLGNAITLPPNYVIGRRTNPSFADPYFLVPTTDRFPTFVPTIDLADQVFDRKLRTPYFQQYNMSVQHAIRANLLLEVAYVGGRGLNLFRNVGINQARLASPQQPIINEVLHALGLPGDVITTNIPANAQLRAPFQGVSTNSFGQRQTTAQSTYNSLQVSLTRRLSSGLQLLGSYTYAKSIDNASGGAFGTGQSADSGFILGNQLDNRANRGVSDFDRTHRFVLSYLWDLPRPVWAKRSTTGRLLLSNWQVAGIITAMSGLPIDVVDTGAGSLYGLSAGGSALARPNWAPGETRSTATSNIPAGYLFNPRAFARPVVPAGQLIPSSNGVAVAGATCGQPNVVCTDIGNVGRNGLRGPRQTNVDFSVIKRFPLGESKNIEFRAVFFNLLNHVNFANPISNLNAVQSSGGSIDANGRITNPGDFGRITSTSNNPRLIQLALKFNF
jgi:hypothetical protein